MTDLVRAEQTALAKAARLDRKLFAEAMARMGVIFDKAIDKALMAVWFDAVADLETADFQAVVAEVIRNNRFFPRPVEIREAAAERARRRAEQERAAAQAEERRAANEYAVARAAALKAELEALKAAGPPKDDAELLRRAALFAERDGRISLVFSLRSTRPSRINGTLALSFNYMLGLYRNDLAMLLQEAAGQPVRFILTEPAE